MKIFLNTDKIQKKHYNIKKSDKNNLKQIKLPYHKRGGAR